MSVSELPRGRAAGESSNGRGLLAAAGGLIGKVRSSIGKLFSGAVMRVVLVFAIGFAAGMAWQTYGSVVRTAVAGWSPHLAWVAPAAASGGNSRERIKATSVALAAVRQSVDKLATEVDKLQEQGSGDQRSGSRRGSQRH